MRRAKTTCPSTCCWSAVRRPRCAPSSSSPSSTPRGRRPKLWVSLPGSRGHQVLDNNNNTFCNFLLALIFKRALNVDLTLFVRRVRLQKARERTALFKGKTGALKSSSGETSSSMRPTASCPTTSSRSSARYAASSPPRSPLPSAPRRSVFFGHCIQLLSPPR